ncbi:MAG: LysM peptidoglycan-binding domain-containing protein, partial [Acidobacteria bacterium]|nr:LysM peptidoglycan-binding domain-containing protein [Acidobacteriota bacterium]
MKFGPRIKTIALGVVTAPLLVLGISACGGDVGGTATTLVPIAPTDFATIPPVITTAPASNTTLPPGSVGVEQTYVVELGDSPIKLATMYGISVEELLMYNGWVSVTQFPYPGQSLRIPPTAKTTTDQAMSQTTLTPQGPAGQGCGSRP